jgi:hypothetical protein
VDDNTVVEDEAEKVEECDTGVEKDKVDVASGVVTGDDMVGDTV